MWNSTFGLSIFRRSFKAHVPKSVFGLGARTSYVSTVWPDVHEELNKKGSVYLIIFIHTNIYIYICIDTFRFSCKCVCMYTYSHSSLYDGCLYSEIVSSLCVRTFAFSVVLPIWIYVHVQRDYVWYGVIECHCVHLLRVACMRSSVAPCMCVYMYACIVLCMYVCMHVCMHVCMYVFI